MTDLETELVTPKLHITVCNLGIITSHFRKISQMKFILPAALLFLAACSVEKVPVEEVLVEGVFVEEVVSVIDSPVEEEVIEEVAEPVAEPVI